MRFDLPKMALPCLLLSSCASLQDLVPGTSKLRQTGALHLGQRVFDHHSTNCIDEQPNMGFSYLASREDGAFGFELGLERHSDRQTLPATGNTKVQGYELMGGIRREFPIEGISIVPYAGVGFELFQYERDNELGSQTEGKDQGIGAYLRVGATLMIDEHAFVGFDVRFIEEEWLNDDGYDLDGDVVSLVFGMSY
ncbi:MAG: hypothetical protein ACJAZ8_000874 [Planctomycetota bacterium]|jgi:hypothetical protein